MTMTMTAMTMNKKEKKIDWLLERGRSRRRRESLLFATDTLHHNDKKVVNNGNDNYDEKKNA